MANTPATYLRAKDIETLESDVLKMKESLLKARIDIQLKGSRNVVKSIRDTKRNIARHLTVITKKYRESLQKKVADDGIKQSQIPKELRPKLTRALRRKLTPKQENMKPSKVYKKLAVTKLRNYAVMA